MRKIGAIESDGADLLFPFSPLNQILPARLKSKPCSSAQPDTPKKV